jgi:hypothetical protein
MKPVHRRSWSFSFETNRLTKRTYSLSETTFLRAPISSPTPRKELMSKTIHTTKPKPKPYQWFMNTFHSRYDSQKEA